jgi:hypothetical protein
MCGRLTACPASSSKQPAAAVSGWSTGTDGNQHHQHHSSTAPAHDRRAATYSRIAFSSASFPRVGQGLQYALRARQPAPLTVLGACDDQRLASVLGLAPLSLTCRTARAPIRPSLCLSLHLHLHLHPHPQPCVCRAWPAKSPLLHSHTSLSPPPPLIARCPLTLLPSSPPRRCRHHSSPTPNTQHPTANTHHPADPLPRLHLYLAASLACPDRFLTPSAPPSRYCPPHSCRRFRSTRLACRIRPSRSRRPTHLHQSLADPRYICSAPTPPWTVRSHCHSTCLLPLSLQPQPLQWPPAQPKTLPPAPTTATAMAAVPLARLCCSL